MLSENLRNQTYNAVTRSFVESGQAPHYTELAHELELLPTEALQAQREVADTSLACWFTPEADTLASWAPFSNIPNQHRVTIDGQQKWFGQCGAEVLATPLMFPGKEVWIESHCPQTGEVIRVRIRDSELVDLSPPTAVVLINQPFDRIKTPFSPGAVYSLPYA